MVNNSSTESSNNRLFYFGRLSAAIMICLASILVYVYVCSLTQGIAAQKQDLEECLLNTATRFNVVSGKEWDLDFKGKTEKFINNLGSKKCRAMNEFGNSYAYCISAEDWKKVLKTQHVVVKMSLMQTSGHNEI